MRTEGRQPAPDSVACAVRGQTRVLPASHCLQALTTSQAWPTLLQRGTPSVPPHTHLSRETQARLSHQLRQVRY